VARRLGLRGIPLCPHPSEGVKHHHHHHAVLRQNIFSKQNGGVMFKQRRSFHPLITQLTYFDFLTKTKDFVRHLYFKHFSVNEKLI